MRRTSTNLRNKGPEAKLELFSTTNLDGEIIRSTGVTTGPPSPTEATIRHAMLYSFGAFEYDARTGELSKSGVRLRLGGQPRQVLALLIERPGDLVTRQAIKDALWNDGTFTDFDHGVDTAIERIRRALGDSARAPRFIETLPRQGYRFVAPVRAGRGASSRPNRGPAKLRRLPRVAVLPFRTSQEDPETASFAEALTQDITTGISLFRHLIVVSSSAAAGFQVRRDVREVGNELNARFLVDGTIRRAGSNIRVNVQLLDSETGAHLWAERMNLDLEETDILDSQDELTDQIVATVADPFGVLTRSLGELAKAKPAHELTPDECVLRWFSYWGQVREEEHAELRDMFERVLKQEPGHADAWACLCFLYNDEIRHDYNVRPGAPDRALRAAQTAAEIDKTSTLAYRALAEAHFFRGEIGPFRRAADRVLALNPRDTSNVGFMGTLISYSGDWETGCAVVRKAVQLNPHHGGWMHIVLALDHVRRREHEQALAEAEQINMPGYTWASGLQAIVHAHLGHEEEAQQHLAVFLELAPDMARTARAEASAWLPANPDLAEHCLEGLRKAGLDLD